MYNIKEAGKTTIGCFGLLPEHDHFNPFARRLIMSKKLIYLILVLVPVLSGGLVFADPFQQDPGPDGIVSMEAENYDDNIERGGIRWEEVGPTDGFTGTAGMQALGASFYNAGYSTQSPQLDYEINFLKTGTYYVWILAWAASGTDDSCHVGLDGEETPLSSNWSGGGNNWSNDRYPETGQAQFDVNTPGLHVLNIWVREDGLIVDKILLTTNPNYTPTGSGPPESWRGSRLKAYNPIPADGATHTETWVSLSWTPGDFAVSHDVYIGDNFDDVNEGTGETFRSNQASPYYVIGFPGYAYPEGLIPGTTYYWRIDEVNETEADSPWKGIVWSFSIPPKTANNPVPADGAKFIDTDNPTLSWSAGFGAKLHTMYIGDDFDTVANATVGVPLGGTTYKAGALEPATTYYWRVDEFDAAATHKGDIWSFTTAKTGGGVKGQYYKGMNFDTLILTRTDPQIDFDWGDPGGPDPAVGDDTFSVKWAGEVEAVFTETYTFYTRSDDGVRLWVDGQQLVDNWTDHSATENRGMIDLVAGNKYSFQMEYYENTGGAIAELRWSSPSTPKQLIPQAALSPPISASGPNPVNRATGASLTPILTWNSGDFAVSHEVYFGTDADAVKNASKSSPEYKGTKALGDEIYDPGKLAWATMYYWRIDEVNDAHPDSPWVGNVWSFTTGDFLLIDDFEDYNADENQIWYSWHDGLGYGTQGTANYFAGNGTGAAVGDETTTSYTEETIVHGGSQSMPLAYDNNKQDYAKYSEAELTLTATRDWTEEGVGELSLWFHGQPASVGSFVEAPVGTYTMTATGTDIWNAADEFHYAYKTLSGPGTIVAQVLSVDNTNDWAKAGVMIRETLEPSSKFAAVYITPGNGCRFQARTDTDIDATSDTSVATAEQITITAPYWVKLERDVAGNFRGYYSANGTTWQTLVWRPTITMSANVYVGLALTSHDAALTCEAKFSNVTITGTAGQQWAHQDIGIVSNAPEPLYVALSNSAGAPAVVYHDDPAAATIDAWTEWVITLQAFVDQGVVLTNVDRIAVGLGTKGNMTVPGGLGKMYIDDIRLYRTRNTAE
jgi:hypothetical protein